VLRSAPRHALHHHGPIPVAMLPRYGAHGRRQERANSSAFDLCVSDLLASATAGYELIGGSFRLRCCWSLHLFLGRPSFLLPVAMYSYVNLCLPVSGILSI
jgi:hypothetical protein